MLSYSVKNPSNDKDILDLVYELLDPIWPAD